MKFIEFKAYAQNSLKFWEPARVIYNVVLLMLVIGHVIANQNFLVQHGSINMLIVLIVLAVLANIAYCAAYIIDFFLQCSELPTYIRTGRFIVFAVGTLFAACLTHLFSSEIFWKHGFKI